MLNKEFFLKKEGDLYYKRNYDLLTNKDLKKNILIKELEKLLETNNFKSQTTILEIGCANGINLDYLKNKYPKNKFFGLEPSKLAIRNRVNKKIIIKAGTADKIPFSNNTFRVIIFGFCLYLCDDSDLISIFKESDRVLKRGGYIIIEDFFSSSIIYNSYKHNKKINIRKMDYSRIFAWHPNYNVVTKKIFKYHKYSNNKFQKLGNLSSLFVIKKK